MAEFIHQNTSTNCSNPTEDIEIRSILDEKPSESPKITHTSNQITEPMISSTTLTDKVNQESKNLSQKESELSSKSMNGEKIKLKRKLKLSEIDKQHVPEKPVYKLNNLSAAASSDSKPPLEKKKKSRSKTNKNMCTESGVLMDKCNSKTTQDAVQSEVSQTKESVQDFRMATLAYDTEKGPVTIPLKMEPNFPMLFHRHNTICTSNSSSTYTTPSFPAPLVLTLGDNFDAASRERFMKPGQLKSLTSTQSNINEELGPAASLHVLSRLRDHITRSRDTRSPSSPHSKQKSLTDQDDSSENATTEYMYKLEPDCSSGLESTGQHQKQRLVSSPPFHSSNPMHFPSSHSVVIHPPTAYSLQMPLSHSVPSDASSISSHPPQNSSISSQASENTFGELHSQFHSNAAHKMSLEYVDSKEVTPPSSCNVTVASGYSYTQPLDTHNSDNSMPQLSRHDHQENGDVQNKLHFTNSAAVAERYLHRNSPISNFKTNLATPPPKKRQFLQMDETETSFQMTSNNYENQKSSENQYTAQAHYPSSVRNTLSPTTTYPSLYQSLQPSDADNHYDYSPSNHSLYHQNIPIRSQCSSTLHTLQEPYTRQASNPHGYLQEPSIFCVIVQTRDGGWRTVPCSHFYDDEGSLLLRPNKQIIQSLLTPSIPNHSNDPFILRNMNSPSHAVRANQHFSEHHSMNRMNTTMYSIPFSESISCAPVVPNINMQPVFSTSSSGTEGLHLNMQTTTSSAPHFNIQTSSTPVHHKSMQSPSHVVPRVNIQPPSPQIAFTQRSSQPIIQEPVPSRTPILLTTQKVELTTIIPQTAPVMTPSVTPSYKSQEKPVRKKGRPRLKGGKRLQSSNRLILCKPSQDSGADVPISKPSPIPSEKDKKYGTINGNSSDSTKLIKDTFEEECPMNLSIKNSINDPSHSWTSPLLKKDDSGTPHTQASSKSDPDVNEKPISTQSNSPYSQDSDRDTPPLSIITDDSSMAPSVLPSSNYNTLVPLIPNTGNAQVCIQGNHLRTEAATSLLQLANGMRTTSPLVTHATPKFSDIKCAVCQISLFDENAKIAHYQSLNHVQNLVNMGLLSQDLWAKIRANSGTPLTQIIDSMTGNVIPSVLFNLQSVKRTDHP